VEQVRPDLEGFCQMRFTLQFKKIKVPFLTISTLSQRQTHARCALMFVHAECCAQVTIAMEDWTEFGSGTNAPGRDGKQGWKAPLLCNDVEPADQQMLGPTSPLTALWNISQAHVT
jgi:hypothetical protein